MAQSIVVPSGDRLEFPDGMPDSEIEKAIHAEYPDLAPKPSLMSRAGTAVSGAFAQGEAAAPDEQSRIAGLMDAEKAKVADRMQPRMSVPGSVLDQVPVAKMPATDSAAIDNLGVPVTPEFMNRVRRQMDAAAPEQRAVLASRPDMFGRAATEILRQQQNIDQTASSGEALTGKTAAVRALDTRKEARSAALARQGLDPQYAAGVAEQDAARGGDQMLGGVDTSNFDFETAAAYKDANPIVKGAAAGVTELGKQGVAIHTLINEALGRDEMADKGRAAWDALGRKSDAINNDSSLDVTTRKGSAGKYLGESLGHAVTSVITNAPGLALSFATGGGGAGLMLMAGQVGADEVLNGRKRGLSNEEALARGVIYGWAEAVGEKFGLDSFKAFWKEAAKGVKTSDLPAFLATHLKREIPGELLTTNIQYGTDVGYGLEKPSLERYLQQNVDTVVQTLMQGGMMSAGGAVLQKSANAIRPEPDLTAGVQFNPDAIDAYARQQLDPANAQMRQVGARAAPVPPPASTRAELAAVLSSDKPVAEILAAQAPAAAPAQPTPQAPVQPAAVGWPDIKTPAVATLADGQVVSGQIESIQDDNGTPVARFIGTDGMVWMLDQSDAEITAIAGTPDEDLLAEINASQVSPSPILKPAPAPSPVIEAQPELAAAPNAAPPITAAEPPSAPLPTESGGVAPIAAQPALELPVGQLDETAVAAVLQSGASTGTSSTSSAATPMQLKMRKLAEAKKAKREAAKQGGVNAAQAVEAQQSQSTAPQQGAAEVADVPPTQPAPQTQNAQRRPVVAPALPAAEESAPDAAPVPNAANSDQGSDRGAVAEERAYTKGQAEVLARRMTNQGLPSEAYPHPTQAGMWAIRVPGEEQPADAGADFLASNRAEFRHEGFRIYPISIKGEPRWAVQSVDNAEKEAKGERQIGGDAIVDTPEQAKKQAEDQVTERGQKAERQRQFAEQDAAEEAKKEANRGLSITQRRANAALDKPTNLPVNAGVGRGTRREAMESAVSQERAITAVDVRDTAAYKRDEDEQGRLHRAGYGAFFGNDSHPQKMRFNELSAKLKNRDNYQKKEYRLYMGRDTEGSFYDITKTEYDYAQALIATKKSEASTPAPSAPKADEIPSASAADLAEEMSRLRALKPRPLNKLYGQNPTQQQIDSHKEATRIWEKAYRKVSVAQKAALERDNAAFAASKKIADEPGTIERVEQPQHIEAGQAETATVPVIAASIKESAKNTPMNIEQAREWLLSEIDKAIIDAKSAKDEDVWDRAEGKVDLKGRMDVKETIGYKVFDVPGDGRFSVLNLKESLQKFKKQVAATPGFKKNATRPMSVANGSGGKTSVRDMLEDGEYVLAADYGRLIGEPLLFGAAIGRNDHPVAYTNAEPVDIKGVDAQVGREWNQTGKAFSWRVIETTTGAMISSGTTKERAVSEALAKVDEHGVDKLIAQIKETPKVSQSELERQFTDWGSEEEAKAQKTRDAVERADTEDRALWNSIFPLKDGEKRSPNPWNDIDHMQVVILAKDAAKAGKGDEFVSLIERRRGGTNNMLALAARKALADAAPKTKPAKEAKSPAAAYPFYSNNKLLNAEGTAELPKDWTGVARSDSGKRFFYLGQENGERSFNPLKAEIYEDALKEADGLKSDKPVIPEGYREVARGYFGGAVEKPIYAPFAEGERVRFIGGHAGQIQGFIGGPVTTGAIIKYDNGLTGRAEWRDVEAVKKPAAEQEPKNFKSIDALNAANNPLGEDDWIRFADGSEWQVKGRMNGWVLMQGKTEHPTVKNIMGQVQLIRAVIEANDAAQPKPNPIADAADAMIKAAEAMKAAVAQQAAPEAGKPAATKEPAQGAEKVGAGETATVKDSLTVPQGKEAAASLPSEAAKEKETDTGIAFNSIAEFADPSKDEAERVQAGIEGKDIIGAAQWLVDNAPPMYSAIASKVLASLKRQQSDGMVFEFHVMHPGDSVPMAATRGRGATSYNFDFRKNVVAVWINGADVTGKVGTSYETVLHELVHAATISATVAGRRGAGTEMQKHVFDLEDVTNAVIDHFNQRVKDAAAGKVELTEFEKSIQGRGSNAFASIDETLAWTLSSPDAQTYLEAIPYKSKSAWTAFVEAIRKILGLTPRHDTALSEVLRVSEVIMEDGGREMRGLLGLDGIQHGTLQPSNGTGMMYSGAVSNDGPLNSLEDDQRSAVSRAIDRAISQDSEQPTDTKRGAGWLKIKLRQAQHKGDLSAKAVEMVEWLIKQNPALVKYLAVAVENPKVMEDGDDKSVVLESRAAMDTYAKHSIDPENVPVGDWAGRTIFHGTSDAGADSIHSDGVIIDKSTGGYFGVGFYAATDANLAANNYADFAEENDIEGKGSVIAVRIKDTARILDLRDEKDWEAYQKADPGGRGLSLRDFAEKMTRQGIDGLFDRSFGGVVIYNPKAIEVLPDAPISANALESRANQPTTGAAGNYNPFTQVMTLFRGNASDTTAVHEILHHLERMIPAEMQAEIRKEWLRAVTSELQKATKAKDQKRIDYFTAVLAGDQKKATELLTGKGMEGFNAAPTFRVVDLFGNGSRVQHFDDRRGLFYESQKYPSGKVGWRAGEVVDGQESWLSAKEFDSMEEAQKAVRGLRISNTAKQNAANKYGAIPSLWRGEERRVAKAIIDAGIAVDRFSSSTQSKSKYLFLESGVKVRLADHALPSSYDQADVDYRYGGDVPALIAEIKQAEQGNVGFNAVEPAPTFKADEGLDWLQDPPERTAAVNAIARRKYMVRGFLDGIEANPTGMPPTAKTIGTIHAFASMAKEYGLDGYDFAKVLTKAYPLAGRLFDPTIDGGMTFAGDAVLMPEREAFTVFAPYIRDMAEDGVLQKVPGIVGKPTKENADAFFMFNEMPKNLQDEILRRFLKNPEKLFGEIVSAIGAYRDEAAASLALSDFGAKGKGQAAALGDYQESSAAFESERLIARIMKRGPPPSQTNQSNPNDLAIGQDYQYLNPSEFWAVRMTNTAQARFEAKSIWARSLQWLREALEHIKGALGLKSDHPLLKALDDLIARGTGEFVSKEMLGSSEVYASIEESGPEEVTGTIMRDASLAARLLLHPRQIAANHKPFVPVFDTAIKQFEERDRIVSGLGEMAKPYFEMTHAQRLNVNKIVEQGRLDRTVYTVADLENGIHHAESGDLVTLDAEEIGAYKSLRKTFNEALSLFRDTMLEEFGFAELIPEQKAAMKLRQMIADGEIEESRIEWARHVAKAIDEIEQAKRTGYAPFNRYGQFVVAVKALPAGVEVQDDDGKQLVTGIPEYGDDPMIQIVTDLGGQYDVYRDGWVIDDTRKAVLRALETTLFATKVEVNAFNEWRKQGKDVTTIPEVKAAFDEAKRKYGKAPNARVLAFHITEKAKADDANLSTFDELARISDVDVETWDAVREKLQEAIKAKSFRKHFFGSDNTPGYSVDFERSVADYIIGMSGYLARRKHVKDFDNAIKRIKAPALAKYAEDYRKYVNAPADEFALLKNIGFLYYIAGSTATAAANLTQVPMLTMPTLVQFVPHHIAAREVARAWGETLAMFSPTKTGLQMFDPAKVPADVRDVFKTAWEDQLFVPLETLDLMAASSIKTVGGRKTMRALSVTTQAIAYMFMFAERLNRITTFIAAARISRMKVAKDRMRDVVKNDAWARHSIGGRAWGERNFAEWAVDESQYRMGKVNRPTVMRGVGSPLLQFKGYMIQTLEAGYRMAVMHGKGGKPAALAALAMMLMLGGIWGLPGLEDLREMIERLYKVNTGKDLDLKTEVRQLIARTTGSAALAAATNKGIPYATVGVDMSRVGMGNILPDSALQVAGIPVDLAIARPMRASEKMAAGKTIEGLSEFLPNFLKNAAMGLQWKRDGLRDKLGTRMMTPGEFDYGDVAIKSLGWTPTKVTNRREYTYAESRAERGIDELKRRYTNDLVRAYVHEAEAKDPAEKAEYKADQAKILARIEEHNKTASPENLIKLDPGTLRRKAAAEFSGSAAREGKERKLSRGAAQDRRELFQLGR